MAVYHGPRCKLCRREGVKPDLYILGKALSGGFYPVSAVVGRREAAERTVALRRLGGQVQEVLPLVDAVRRLATEATPPDLMRAG